MTAGEFPGLYAAFDYRAINGSMVMKYGFGRFVGLDGDDAPELLARMSKRELGVDGERYGIFTRLIARPGVTVADLASEVVRKLLGECSDRSSCIGALVLSSRIVDVEQTASAVVDRLELTCPSYGIERACSGFPAATELGLQLCRKLDAPVVVVAAEIISGSINWESPDGNLADHRRGAARHQSYSATGRRPW